MFELISVHGLLMHLCMVTRDDIQIVNFKQLLRNVYKCYDPLMHINPPSALIEL